MDETRLREQLDRLAGDAGVPDLDDHRVLGRARRRRALTGGLTALLVVAVGTAGFLGVRSVLDRPPTTLGQDPVPTDPPGVTTEGFPGLWPETSEEALAAAQRAVDEGHSPLRTTPVGTALEAVMTLLGWEDVDVSFEGRDSGAEAAVFELRNRRFAEEVPPVTVMVRQLGVQGERGIWSVVAMSTPLIHVDVDASDDVPTLHISGEVTDLYEGASAVDLLFLSGPTREETVGQTTVEFVSDRRFEVEFEPQPTPDGRAVLLVSMPDAVGESLGATLVPVPTSVGDPEPAIHLEGAPPDVAVTAQRLLDGVLAHDLDALAELIDPNTFVHDFDDGSDPIPGWREDPTVLDAIPGVLRLPFVIQDIEGYGTFYVWPYLMKEGALDDVTEQERADLHSLGFSDAEIERMREFGSYIGPRLAIDADGLWRNYVTGGD